VLLEDNSQCQSYPEEQWCSSRDIMKM
jgi:hypothetical protein